MALTLTKDFKGVIFAPRKDEIKPGGGVLYPRIIELHCAGEENGTLLATFEYYADKEPAVIPIYKSADGGKTWEHLSDVADTKNNWGDALPACFVRTAKAVRRPACRNNPVCWQFHPDAGI